MDMMFFWGFPFFGIILVFMVVGLTMRVLRRFFLKSDRHSPPRAFPFEDEFFLPSVDGYNSSYEGLENRIFKLAYDLKGKLTLSDVVVGTSLTMKEAEDYMNRMVDSSHVRMEVEDDGTILYEFPEIKKRFDVR